MSLLDPLIQQHLSDYMSTSPTLSAVYADLTEININIFIISPSAVPTEVLFGPSRFSSAKWPQLCYLSNGYLLAGRSTSVYMSLIQMIQLSPSHLFLGHLTGLEQVHVSSFYPLLPDDLKLIRS